MIRTFKKENGGYALLYVMVVIVVVCAIVMAICTSAMENYKAQQDSVTQMQAKYAVMGEVEKKLAVLEEDFSLSVALDADSYKDYLVYEQGFREDGLTVDGEGTQYTVTFVEVGESNRITVEVEVKVDITEVDEQIHVSPHNNRNSIKMYAVEAVEGGAA